MARPSRSEFFIEAPFDQLYEQAMKQGYCQIPSPHQARRLGQIARSLESVFFLSRRTPYDKKGSPTFLNALAKAEAEQRSSKGTWYRLLEESP